MVLASHGLKLPGQARIGYELGLTLPPEPHLKRLFPKAKFSTKPMSYGYGTRVAAPRYSVNSYFKRHMIPLRETYITPDKIHDIGKTISKNLAEGNDLIVCFNNKKLYGKGDWGHVCVIEGLNKGGIRLLDPDNKPYRITVKPGKLLRAIRYHGRKNRGGIWMISKVRK